MRVTKLVGRDGRDGREGRGGGGGLIAQQVYLVFVSRLTAENLGPGDNLADQGITKAARLRESGAKQSRLCQHPGLGCNYHAEMSAKMGPPLHLIKHGLKVSNTA